MAPKWGSGRPPRLCEEAVVPEVGRVDGVTGRLHDHGDGLRGHARKEEGPPPLTRLGPWRVQLRFAIELTLEQYVAREAWKAASLERCPEHPEGGCGFASHGAYPRKWPVACKVARWYCPTGHKTFSLLPDCRAARMMGTLEQTEQAAVALERGEVLEVAAERIRPSEQDADAVGLAAAVRWMKRRHCSVTAGLIAITVLMPELFVDCAATVDGFAGRLGAAVVLVALREHCAAHLQAVPAPIGFLPSATPARPQIPTTQQSMRTRR